MGLDYYDINLNGRELRLFEKTLTYEQIIKLAFGEHANTSILYTITVHHKSLSCTIKREELLHLTCGTVWKINVADTGYA
jgi:hypothetical protein